MNNPFEVLGLKGLATPDEIRIHDLAGQRASGKLGLGFRLGFGFRLGNGFHSRLNGSCICSCGILRSLIRCEERTGEWYYMQGQVLMAMEEFNSAHQSYREAVRLDPENNVYRAGALAAAVALQKEQKLPGKVRRVFKNLVKR